MLYSGNHAFNKQTWVSLRDYDCHVVTSYNWTKTQQWSYTLGTCKIRTKYNLQTLYMYMYCKFEDSWNVEEYSTALLYP